METENFDFLKYQKTEKPKTWFLVLILYKLIIWLFSICLLVLFLRLLYKVGVEIRYLVRPPPLLFYNAPNYIVGWSQRTRRRAWWDWYTQYSIYLRNMNPAGGSRGELLGYGAHSQVQFSVLLRCTINLNNE